MKSPLLTIVLPTFNEAANVKSLLFAIRETLQSDVVYEILFVDDSSDETPNIIKTEIIEDSRVRMIHREPENRTGLATAFVLGFNDAKGKYICCMDSDLQHPPEEIRTLLQKIVAEGDDIVVASRYILGGNADGLGGVYRKFVSVASKYFAQIILEPTRRSSDPGSGFFIFRKSILERVQLSPRGFKILIEILVKTNTERVTEVPIKFLKRENDESKASIKQGIEFLKHLWRLFYTVPHAGRFIKFGFVGSIGVVVNLGTLYLLVERYGANLYATWLVAVLLSILSNFVLNALITYSDRPVSGVLNYVHRLGTYYLFSLGAIVINFIIYHSVLSLGLHYLIAATAGILVATLINFAFASSVVWPSSEEAKELFIRKTTRLVWSKDTSTVLVFSFTLSASIWYLMQDSFMLHTLVLMSLFLAAQGLYALFLMLYAWEDPERSAGDKSPTQFHAPQLSFTALVPVRHEEEVIEDTLRAISSFTYPSYLMETIVICSHDDVGTIRAVRHAISKLDTGNISLTVYSKPPINKPHGLNVALKKAKHDVVVIFDAEDEPHKDIYNIANTVMLRDNADVVQSGVQLMNYRSSWFSMFNVMEYYFWFKSSLHFYARAGVIPLGGNTVFFKRDKLLQVGGWDHYCLTEDADIGLRLSKLGAKIRVVYDEQHTTREETPPDVIGLVKQRTRWNHGFLQILLKGEWLSLPFLHQRVLALYILSWPVMNAILFLSVPFSVWFALNTKIPVLYAILLNAPLYIFILHLTTFIIGLYEFTRDYKLKYPFWLPLKAIIYYYPYQLLLGYSALRAVGRLIRGDLTWEKTLHINAHRSSNTSIESPIISHPQIAIEQTI